MTVSPRRLTAACSRSAVMVLAICTTTSSWIRRVSVSGGISTTLRSRPGRICCPAAPGGGAGGGCGGSRMPFWTSVITGGVLSAASCVVAVRFWMICVCWAASDSRNSASGVPEGGGRMPVLTKKHSASLQFPTIDGNPGGRDAEVGSFAATNGSVVLPGPPVALPEADELVMLPEGKLDAGIESGREIDEPGIGPGEAADQAVGGAGGVAGGRGAVDAAEIGADEAADDVVVAGAGDGRVRRRERCRDGAQVHAGEAAEIAVAGPGDGAGGNGCEDRAAGQAGEPADDAVGPGARDRPRGRRREDQAGTVLEAERADEAAQHAVAAAGDVPECEAVGDEPVAGSDQAAGDARRADRDVTERLRVEDRGGVEVRRTVAHACNRSS